MDILRANLAEVRDDAERAAVLDKQVAILKDRLRDADAATTQQNAVPAPSSDMAPEQVYRLPCPPQSYATAVLSNHRL